MPQYGSYTDGSPGVAGDEIIAKRSTGTSVRLPLSALPVPSGAVPRTEYDTFVENTNSSLSTKQGSLTATGLAELSGNTLYVGQAEVAGTLLDGAATFCLPSGVTTGFGTIGCLVTAVATTGTTATVPISAPANYWENTGRISTFTTAAAAQQANVRYAPRARLPESNTATAGGFKSVFTYSVSDANPGASAVGIFQQTQTAGTQPSAYTNGRIYFYFDKGDTTWKFKVNSTLVATFSAASFPTGGSNANPYEFEIEVTPAPSFAVNYRMRHLLTNAEISGTWTGTYSGAWSPLLMMIRDTVDSTLAVSFQTTGMATGAFTAFTVGDPGEAIAAPVTLTGATSVTRLTHANRSIYTNSASTFAITIPATGFSPGDVIYGVNIGTADITIVGSGHTIAAHADVAPTVEQYQGFSVECISDGVWVRTA